VIQPDGTLRPVQWGTPDWESVDAGRAQTHYDELARLSAAKARTRIVEHLRESGDLVGEPRPITHAVKFYEKGDRPLEIVTSRQWFIKTIEYRDELLARGESSVAPGVHAGAVRKLGERAERRLVRQPAALLRRAVSGVVSGECRRPRGA
jgi:valyl-tRNA synthetase